MKQSTREALDNYRDKGIPPSDFFYAVLTNNLKESFMRADYDNERDMREIVTYCYQYLPAGSWGSESKVAQWVLQGGLEGIEHDRQTA